MRPRQAPGAESAASKYSVDANPDVLLPILEASGQDEEPEDADSTARCCSSCSLCMLRFALNCAACLLGLLTFTFAALVAPFAMYAGRPPSALRLKHAIRQAGGKFVTWGDGAQEQEHRVLEYFVFGSKDSNADVFLLFAGALSPGDVWGALIGENSADVWGKNLGLKVICPTNPGLGASTLAPNGNVLTKDQIVLLSQKVLAAERVPTTTNFFVGGMSQGSHVAGIIADRMCDRVKGVLFMCPYMPAKKLHELYFGGKPCELEEELEAHPNDTPVKVIADCFPTNFMLFMLTTKALPYLKHAFCLFQRWAGFNRKSLVISPDMLAATARCDADGNGDWVESFLTGSRRGNQFNIYGESTFHGFGDPKRMCGKDGKTKVVVCTDVNLDMIPDILCSSRQSWWWVENIPGARLLTCNEGYGHLTEYLFAGDIMRTVFEYFRGDEAEEAAAEAAAAEAAAAAAAAAATAEASDIDGVAPSLRSRRSVRSATSGRTRFRRRHRDVCTWTDHETVKPPAVDKLTPIPWLRRRQSSPHEIVLTEWMMMAYTLRLHFGFVFIVLLFGLMYSFTSFVVWAAVGIPTMVCAVGAVVLGPLFVLLLITTAKHQDPTSELRIVLNSASVIQQGVSENDVAIVRHGSGSSLASLFAFVLWVAANSACVWFINGGQIYDGSGWIGDAANGNGNETKSSNATDDMLPCPLWLQVWHMVASSLFAYISAHLLSLMSTGMRAIRMASGEIVSKIRTWAPPEQNTSGDGCNGRDDFEHSLAMIAADITLLDESCVNTFSVFFGSMAQMLLFSNFLLILSAVVALLEDRSWLDGTKKAGVCVIGLLLGFGALGGKALSVMATTSSICQQIPQSMNRLRMRMVEGLDMASRAGAGAGARAGAEIEHLRAISESVRALCDGAVQHPMGFKLSGFVVTPKLVMQVLYAGVSIIFLVLVGRGGGL